MQNFQNELQSLEMDSYQVGELTPISYQEDPRVFGGLGVGVGFGGGGFNRCGGHNCFSCFMLFQLFQLP